MRKTARSETMGNSPRRTRRMSVVLLTAGMMVFTWVSPALAVTTATVCLYDSTGAGIPGGQAQFRSGAWQTIGLTGADGCVSTDAPAALGNRAFRVTYNGQTVQKTQDTSINPTVTFQTISVTGQLLDSTGTGIQGALIQYNASGWKTLGSTDTNGQTSSELFTASLPFRVTYNGQTVQKTQDTSINPTVTFQTISVTGQLLDSTGTGIQGALIQYNASGWKTLGSTDTNGQTSSELFTASLPFRVTYNGQTVQKTQDTSINPTVTFQTISVTGQLLDSTGTGIQGALIQYNASGWKTLGSTDTNGQTSSELFTASLPFRVTYNGQTVQKTQDTSINPTVTFQTGRVLQGTGARVLRYRTSAWQTFFDGVEILPGNVVFDLDVGPNETHTVVAGVSIYVPFAPTPPVITVGPNLTSNEGEEVVVGASYTDVELTQTHTATIDWGDGAPVETGNIVAADGLGGLVEGRHVYADEGSYTVVLCVMDDGSPGASGCESLQVTVVNVAPIVTILGPGGLAVVGSGVNLSADVADPGTADTFSYAWSVTRDSEVVAGGSDSTITFMPTVSGVHVVSLTVDDGDGGIGSTQSAITVIEVEEPEEPPTDPPLDPPVEEPTNPPVDPPVEEPTNPPLDPQVEETDKPASETPTPATDNESSATVPVQPESDNVSNTTGPHHQETDETPTEDGIYELAQILEDPTQTGTQSPTPEEVVAGSIDPEPPDAQVLSLQVSAELADKHGAAQAQAGVHGPAPHLLVIAGLIAALIGVLIGRRLLDEG